MRRSLFLLSLSSLSVFADQISIPHPPQSNTRAKAAEVKANFDTIVAESNAQDLRLDALEELGGGCSATQQDNSVLIECADGSSGVLAGAGNVVVLPGGTVTGEVPDYSQIPVGDFFWEDGSGVLLADYRSSFNPEGLDDWESTSVYDAEESVPVIFLQSASRQRSLMIVGGTVLVYAEADCQGVAMMTTSSNVTHYFQGQYWINSGIYLEGETFIRSQRRTDAFNYETEVYDAFPCENIPNPNPGYGYFPVTWEPPAEWQNITYPITLVQKP